MAGRASAFAALGLVPGADAAAVEQAYKRLIKQHQPDREGGDSSRAAEINQAYRELRSGSAQANPLEFHTSSGRRDVFCLAGRLPCSSPAPPLADLSWESGQACRSAPSADSSNERCVARSGDRPHRRSLGALDSGIRDAVRLYRGKDEMAVTIASRDRAARFRDKPGTGMLDRCAAFDDAVVGLQDRDPLRDAGFFAPLAVTGRQWSAASELSDDSLAIDSRLDQIRLRVEIALAPEVLPVAPAGSTTSVNAEEH